MAYHQLAYLHLATIVPAFLVGSVLFASRKGTSDHRILGKIYLLLMVFTGLITLLMPAQVGPQVFGHFGFIHASSLLTLYSAPAAYFTARHGNIKAHRGYMIGLYIGGILIAGAFAFAPGRMLHHLLFGIG